MLSPARARGGVAMKIIEIVSIHFYLQSQPREFNPDLPDGYKRISRCRETARHGSHAAIVAFRGSCDDA